jgi:hypothetical protein
MSVHQGCFNLGSNTSPKSANNFAIKTERGAESSNPICSTFQSPGFGRCQRIDRNRRVCARFAITRGPRRRTRRPAARLAKIGTTPVFCAAHDRAEMWRDEKVPADLRARRQQLSDCRIFKSGRASRFLSGKPNAQKLGISKSLTIGLLHHRPGVSSNLHFISSGARMSERKNARCAKAIPYPKDLVLYPNLTRR